MSPVASGLKISQGRKQHEEGSKQNLCCCLFYDDFLPSLIFTPKAETSVNLQRTA
jgi:hypothetical protein